MIISVCEHFHVSNPHCCNGAHAAVCDSFKHGMHFAGLS